MSDFLDARDITKPFWERERALDRMPKRDADFWARNDVTLPFWVREKYK